MEKHNRKDFIHHRSSKIKDGIREIVFGAEDGMVSTMGALTGIAVGTSNQYTVILAGLVIICVESIAMSVGSFLSNKSVREVEMRKLAEARMEIDESSIEESDELRALFMRDGWPEPLAETMSHVARNNKPLMLREMAYRELELFPGQKESPIVNSLFMLLSYIFGGLIPLSIYFFIPVFSAVFYSVAITLIGLFLLGAITTRFTKRNWFKSGAEMLTLASIAAFVGYIVGQAAEFFG